MVPLSTRSLFVLTIIKKLEILHKKYCAVISQLDSREEHKLEQLTVADSEILPKKYRSQLVRLIVEKPTLKDISIIRRKKGLWDTSSMASVINKHCLKSNFPNEKIFSSEEFLGIPSDLKTGNNTKLNTEGVAFLDFSLKLMFKKVKVPFIVTNEYLENLIFGYDLTEHLSASRDNPKIFDMLMSVFPNILLEGAETMIPILHSIKTNDRPGK